MKRILYALSAMGIIIAIVGHTTEKTIASVTGVIHNGNGGPGYGGLFTIYSNTGTTTSSPGDTICGNFQPGLTTITLSGSTSAMAVGGVTVYPGGLATSFSESGYTWSIWVSSDGLEHYIERL